MPMFNLQQFFTPFYQANPTAAIQGANQVFSDLRHTKTTRDRNTQLAADEDRRQSFNEFNTTRDYEQEERDKASLVMRHILETAQTDPAKAKTLFPMAQAFGITIDTGEGSASAPPDSAFSSPVAPKPESSSAAPGMKPGVPAEKQTLADAPAPMPIKTGAPTVAAPVAEQPGADPLAKQIDERVNPILEALRKAQPKQPVMSLSQPVMSLSQLGQVGSPLLGQTPSNGVRSIGGPLQTPQVAPPMRGAPAPATPEPPPAAPAVPSSPVDPPRQGANGWKFSFRGKPLGGADVEGYGATQRQRAGRMLPGLQALDKNNIGASQAFSGVAGTDVASPEKLSALLTQLVPLLGASDRAQVMAMMSRLRGGTQDRLDQKWGVEAFDKAAGIRGIKTMADGQKLLKAGIEGLQAGNGFESLQTLMGAYKQLDPRMSDKDMGRLLGYQGPIEKFRDWISITATGDISPDTKARVIAGLQDSIRRNEMLMQKEFEGLEQEGKGWLSPEAEQAWNAALHRTMRGYGFDKRLRGPGPRPQRPGGGDTESTSAKVTISGSPKTIKDLSPEGAAKMELIKGILQGKK